MGFYKPFAGLKLWVGTSAAFLGKGGAGFFKDTHRIIMVLCCFCIIVPFYSTSQFFWCISVCFDGVCGYGFDFEVTNFFYI